VTAVGEPVRFVVHAPVVADGNNQLLCHPTCPYRQDRMCYLKLPGQPHVHRLRERHRHQVCLDAAVPAPVPWVAPTYPGVYLGEASEEPEPALAFTTETNAGPATR